MEEAEGGLRNIFQTEAERCRRKLKDAQMVKMTTIVWRVWKKYKESHGIEFLALMKRQHLCTKNLESSALLKKAPLCSNNFNFLLKMKSMSAEPAAFPLIF